jgi:DNA gyrase subunit A
MNSLIPSEDKDIVDVNIEDSVKRSYLDYSMSVIIGRALPDARDGLKPVHRRILYAMNELNLSSGASYKKSARIVGDVIGKYHPHGDSSVYDALVRMAQSFSMRMPLVDGQGNFGSVDGDSPAAMRYTEARMSKPSEDILKDIEKDTVNFTATYDDTGKEPSVLPTRLPLLLANGSEGIAVGMATKIPPHNIAEVLDATLHLVNNPDATVEELMDFIKGPDFPTGGIIFGRQGFTDAYRTGRGKVKIRAKYHIEQNGNKELIVLDELPYQVNKLKLVDQIKELKAKSSVEGIEKVEDMSGREGTRVVISLKKDAEPQIVLNNLYKATPLQTTFGIIMLAVHNKEPKIFTLPQMLEVFLSHRKTVIIRRTIFDLEKAKARAHILEGHTIALDNIDEVVRIIKSSEKIDDAKESLISIFKLSDIQAKSILEMKLSKLTGLEKGKIQNELNELLILIAELELILKSEERLNEKIKEELKEAKSKYNSPRRTDIEDSYDDIDIEDLIVNEPMVVTITHNGYVKRVPIKEYEKQKRGGKGKVAVTTHDDDFIEKFFVSNTHDTLMFVTNLGQLYWLKVYRIPQSGRTAKGKAVVNLINLKDNEKIMAIIPTTDFDKSKSLAFFTKNGIIKRTALDEFSNIRINGVRAIVLDRTIIGYEPLTDEEKLKNIELLKEGKKEYKGKVIYGDEIIDEIVTAYITLPETKYIMIFTALGQVIRFDMDQTRMQGRTTKGVRGIKFKKEDDYVVDAEVIENEEQELLTVSEKGVGKRTEVEAYRLTSRAGSGVISMKLSPKAGKKVVGNVLVDPTQDLMALTSIGKMIRVDMETIRKAGRNTSGVNIVNVDKNDKVVSIAKCPKNKEEGPDLTDIDDNLVLDNSTVSTVKNNNLFNLDEEEV